ncbi:WD repeat-containing protein on Y chromosome isoform X3 [Lingula anatina]|uniref:WD repeat-containing protein on Y chromosome isoform X3 n=1 Tax=Lingula anatina TaxID=7574 RepID=A0A1S3KCV9_LINAN|nr:WD repeat-containing protein on Y chromosome isoform X3 [Lingula anatina]|eukprot:XP_013420475.1 WD repeat-containing protein on Y chromosome isoform X3 [Lingula anatina]
MEDDQISGEDVEETLRKFIEAAVAGGLLSVADSARRRSFANPEKIESFNQDENLKLEQKFKLQHLHQLMRFFQNHDPPPITVESNSPYRPTTYEIREPGALNVEEFKEAIGNTLQTREYDDQLEKLFSKLDTSADGYVDWEEFATYMLLKYRENDYLRTKKLIPFLVDPKIRHILHNRQEPTCRIVAVENPVRFVTISKEGAISVWTPNLSLAGTHTMTQEEPSAGGQKRRFSMWVTDAAYMPNSNKIAIASTSRDLRFYDTSTSKYFEEFHLYSIPDVPYCLTYWFDRKNPSGDSLLIAGMDSGSIYLFYFKKPITQLFETPFQHTTSEGVTKIFFKDLMFHSKCVCLEVIEDIHPDIIRKVMYLPDNDGIISSSASPRNSIVIMDIQKKKRPYVFKMNKGAECFDHNKTLNILVTGSADHVLRVWNPYVVSKPVAILQGHATGVIDVVIHEELVQFFSYSRDAVVKVWDLKEHTCLQTVVMKFPSTVHGRIPEHGPFPLRLQHPPHHALVVSCNDYIGVLRLGQSYNERTNYPTTHKTQLCCAIYNTFYKQVVTGSDDSTIATWDIDTGSKALMLSNAHGEEEITSMVFDGQMRRLITGARNGTIKVWNFQNGHNLHKLEAVAEAEVTGIVPFSDKRIILAVGWSRLITLYDDSHADNTYIKAETNWKGGQVHKEDILSVDYCPPNLLATGTFDGEIVVWSTDTDKLFLRLRKGQPVKIDKRMQEFDISPDPERPPSRPNSRHRKSHKPAKGQAAPVDKLLFLHNRAHGKYLDCAFLISSEAGVLRWWSIYNKKHEFGSFYASDFPDESVLGMCSDPDSSILVTGDTQGHVSVWDISEYCLKAEERRIRHRPPLLAGWRAHDSAIVSTEYVEYSSDLHFILTASTDRTARLWNLDGHYVGTFGQKQQWNLDDPSTWAHPKTPWTVEEDEFKLNLSNGGEEEKSPKMPNISESAVSSPCKRKEDSSLFNYDEIPTIERGETLMDEDIPLAPSTDGETERDEGAATAQDSRAVSTVSIQRADIPVKAKSVTIDTRMNRISTDRAAESTMPTMPNRAQTFAFGTFSASPKSKLGIKVDKDLARKMHDRQERRDAFGEIDIKQASRTGKLCSPFHALLTPELQKIELPPNFPTSAGLLSRTYTTDSLNSDAGSERHPSGQYNKKKKPERTKSKIQKLPAI